ncbi:class I SAM-dependent methyltransferase [Leptolyngbya sp. NK1-12]|uniref:Class I SAM-dependent methyltransferase n=1 Tax=Leptolyngbya sp. NK1-12 TaxID=2547451 RepID=A0AA96WGU4_9CYAN|nr:class I SAM-dependent methyltransferase [Leptolyngbya sp. NK1-12]WNZ25024.1 class I SAM-dependent methyltransferase [Leptolyngbya sp. NK1-12]
MTDQLLLYSLAEFETIIFECLNIIQAKRILEIGCEAGHFTNRLIEWVEQAGGMLYCVEPQPSETVLNQCHQSKHARLIVETSLTALPQIGPCDCCLIDGDHNYYTVSHELELIWQQCQNAEQQPLIFLHDIGWPCAYRDVYYSPEQIPIEARHPFTYQQGVTLACQELIDGGFRGEGAFAWAVHQGGQQNGVMTAVNDFLERHNSFSLAEIPCIFGLGILYQSNCTYARKLQDFLSFYDKNILLAKLEQNRLHLYLKVLELQDQLLALKQLTNPLQ